MVSGRSEDHLMGAVNKEEGTGKMVTHKENGRGEDKKEGTGSGKMVVKNENGHEKSETLSKGTPYRRTGLRGGPGSSGFSIGWGSLKCLYRV